MRTCTVVSAAVFLIALGSTGLLAQSGPVSLQSPDGQLSISIETDGAAGPLSYSATYRGKSLITKSALRLNLAGARPLGESVRIVKQTPSQADETYRLVTGKASTVRN